MSKTWEDLEKLASKAEADGPVFLGAVLHSFAQAWKADLERLEREKTLIRSQNYCTLCGRMLAE